MLYIHLCILRLYNIKYDSVKKCANLKSSSKSSYKIMNYSLTIFTLIYFIFQ